MILLIDNYDSFSYNLVQMFGGLTTDIRVIRNDFMTVEQIKAANPSHIVLSPGPGHPKDAGVCEDVIREMKGLIPILGVCLGHQAICDVFGTDIVHAKKLMHGKQSTISLDNTCPLFQGLPDHIPAARYHSLIADRDTIPQELLITAYDDMGEIMAVRHKRYPIYGVQFHPESLMTPDGITILSNFLTVNT